ncbi:MAG: SOS response-associated peptidase [bacterium]|nr:SOS response-associated peptidase [bacterium]
MCGRYALSKTLEQLEAAFSEIDFDPSIVPRFNVSPGQEVLSLAKDRVPNQYQAGWFEWGLIPRWAEGPSAKPLINARCETLHEKRSFKESFSKRRCLVVADGFYEWKKSSEGKKPFLFQLTDGEPFVMAGVWDCWTAPGGKSERLSCAILTTEANELVRPLHHRMPVILRAKDFRRWLDLEPADLPNIFRPFDASQMKAFEVSRAVNNPSNDRPDMIEPVSGGGQLTFVGDEHV